MKETHSILPNAFRLHNHACAAVLAALLVAISSIPYFYGSSLADEKHVYVGLSPFRSDDANVYVNYLRQVAEGRWLLEDRYNGAAGVKGQFSAFFAIVGGITRVTGASPADVYRLSRPALGWLLLITVYLVATARMGPQIGMWALVIAGSSSGIGWLFRMLDLPMPSFDVLPVGPLVEANTFAAISRSPLHTASMILLIGFFHFLFDYLRDGNRAALGIATACGALLANMHTYDVPVMVVVPVCFWVVDLGMRMRGDGGSVAGSRIPWGLAVVCLAMVPGMWHVWTVMQRDPQFGPANVELGRVSLTGVATTYGCLLLAHAMLLSPPRGLFIDNELRWIRFLCVWSLAGLLVPFLQVAWARKALEGTHLPLSLLAAIALLRLLANERIATKYIRVLAVMILIPSNLMGIVDACEYARVSRAELTAEAPGAYLHRDELAAFHWIEQNTPAGSVFLSSFATGSFLPAWTGKRAFAGHVSETHDLARKARQVLQFYEGRMKADEVRRFLDKERVDYVFWGPREQSLSKGRILRVLPIHRVGMVVIYSANTSSVR